MAFNQISSLLQLKGLVVAKEDVRRAAWHLSTTLLWAAKGLLQHEVDGQSWADPLAPEPSHCMEMPIYLIMPWDLMTRLQDLVIKAERDRGVSQAAIAAAEAVLRCTLSLAHWHRHPHVAAGYATQAAIFAFTILVHAPVGEASPAAVNLMATLRKRMSALPDGAASVTEEACRAQAHADMPALLHPRGDQSSLRALAGLPEPFVPEAPDHEGLTGELRTCALVHMLPALLDVPGQPDQQVEVPGCNKVEGGCFQISALLNDLYELARSECAEVL
ncbi:hypothetical protein WJX81_005615 [Elliptochloris bilobata]|uniref:Uncharacterized protein n=1 Tax=Elliptochloris bilobata TaxID=381761 RepID=A0AAW1SET7_9CHLO